jgi:hypothetical protein
MQEFSHSNLLSTLIHSCSAQTLAGPGSQLVISIDFRMISYCFQAIHVPQGLVVYMYKDTANRPWFSQKPISRSRYQHEPLGRESSRSPGDWLFRLKIASNRCSRISVLKILHPFVGIDVAEAT